LIHQLREGSTRFGALFLLERSVKVATDDQKNHHLG
jgi:hypothetical protein